MAYFEGFPYDCYICRLQSDQKCLFPDQSDKCNIIREFGIDRVFVLPNNSMGFHQMLKGARSDFFEHFFKLFEILVSQESSYLIFS